MILEISPVLFSSMAFVAINIKNYIFSHNIDTKTYLYLCPNLMLSWMYLVVPRRANRQPAIVHQWPAHLRKIIYSWILLYLTQMSGLLVDSWYDARYKIFVYMCYCIPWECPWLSLMELKDWSWDHGNCCMHDWSYFILIDSILYCSKMFTFWVE